MNTQDTQLEQVKKSCKAVSIVLNITKIIFIVGMMVSLVSGIICLSKPEMMNSAASEVDFGNITPTFSIGNISFANRYFEQGDFAKGLGVSLLIVSALLLVLTITFHIFGSIFTAIQKSASPFDETVIKKLKVTFILISVVTLFFIGLGEGVIVGVTCWAIYTIFQYGGILQKQSDETL